MRLINPGPGEYCDRLSILALKIAHGRSRSLPVDHFTREWAAILTKIAATPIGGPFVEQYTQLVVVNARLWQAEDDLRAYRRAGVGGPEVADLAFLIQALNDERAALVAAINKLTGNHVGAEKIEEDRR